MKSKDVTEGHDTSDFPMHWLETIANKIEERNEEIRKSISNLFTLIEEEEIEEAEKTLKKLQEIIGEDDPELLRASIQIEYLKEDE